MIRERSSLRDFDWFLFGIVLLLCAVGVLQIFSATFETKFRDVWWKQLAFLGLSIVLMWIATQIDYHTLISQVPVLYGIGILLLVVTFFTGPIFGSRRWIGYGFARFQTSEFFKVILILAAARYLSEIRGRNKLTARNLGVLAAVFFIPMGLVMAQPDLGTSLTFLPILAVGIFLAGIQWKHIAILALAGFTLLPIAWFLVLKDYQKDRVRTFLDPSRDPKGKGYQVIQSKIAIGSGGVWGQGATKGNQTQLRFLPVAHTDFIFASFAEEHGFVGVSVVLALYFLLILQIVQNAQAAPDRAGLYICMGVGALTLFHLLVNIGMVAGKLPITGIPLPFVSSGGSHMMSMFILLGLVINVRLRRFS